MASSKWQLLGRAVAGQGFHKLQLGAGRSTFVIRTIILQFLLTIQTVPSVQRAALTTDSTAVRRT